MTISLLGVQSPAKAGDFDARGVFSFASDAVVKESFEAFSPIEAGGSKAEPVDSQTALDGQKILRLTLANEGLRLAVDLVSGFGVVRLSYWMRGDAVGGLAVDSDERPSNLAQAYPTGRVTSDGWMEMRTAPIAIDGQAKGLDARVFFCGLRRFGNADLGRGRRGNRKARGCGGAAVMPGD